MRHTKLEPGPGPLPLEQDLLRPGRAQFRAGIRQRRNCFGKRRRRPQMIHLMTSRTAEAFDRSMEFVNRRWADVRMLSLILQKCLDVAALLVRKAIPWYGRDGLNGKTAPIR